MTTLSEKITKLLGCPVDKFIDLSTLVESKIVDVPSTDHGEAWRDLIDKLKLVINKNGLKTRYEYLRPAPGYPRSAHPINLVVLSLGSLDPIIDMFEEEGWSVTKKSSTNPKFAGKEIDPTIFDGPYYLRFKNDLTLAPAAWIKGRRVRVGLMTINISYE